MIKKAFSQILEKEMDRKDFLKLIGLGAVAASGATVILKTLADQQPRRTVATKAHSYGASAYGGAPVQK